MSDSVVPSPCEKDCIMNLIDPPCHKCQMWYQYWADVDSSDMEYYLGLDEFYENYTNELAKECPDPDCICKNDNE